MFRNQIIICNECGDVLDVTVDKEREALAISPCKTCIDKYLNESRIGTAPLLEKSIEASLMALNATYAAIIRQKKGEPKDGANG